MKNIYLLPTQNNKSKLAIYHYDGSKNIKVGEIGLQVNNNIGWTHCWSERELYITSEEEIKEGDWCLDTLNLILFVSDGRVNVHQNTDKKIILTTDPALIKDKVQAINDVFLEWFIKNPSCEEVEVKHIIKEGVVWQKTRSYTYEEMKESFSKGHDSARLKGSYKSNKSFEEDWEIWSNQFKKEPNKESVFYQLEIGKEYEQEAFELGEKIKQETLEEASENYWRRQPYNEDAFEEGAKWQQENLLINIIDVDNISVGIKNGVVTIQKKR